MPPQSILENNKVLANCDKLLPLRDCFLAGLLISGPTKEKHITTLLFALARVVMAQPQWPANGQASLQLFKTNLRWHIIFTVLHCSNLNASAAVKISAKQNAKNVARKVVKMLKINAKKTELLKSCIKEDVSSQGETKRYHVGLCETWFVERNVSIPVKHSK